ncbi:rhodanese-like domain-containing protein [Chloroflexota bacterium]
MRAIFQTRLILIIALLALFVAMPLLSACGSEAPAPAPVPAPAPAPTAPAAEKAEFDVVKAAVAGYLAEKATNVKAADLNMKIADGNSPYIVSIRSADDYAAGHIPGAVNLKFGELSKIPMDEEVLVYCYTGQSASFAVATLGVLGYDVSNLLHGMASWSDNPDVFKKRFDAEKSQGSFKTETTPPAGESYALPVLDNTASSDDAEIVKAAALTVAPKYISAADLNLKITEGEEMTILSVRAADHYAAGHVPGAINIGMGSLMDNLNKLNPDAPVYVYCYTGHSAAQTAALLQVLGYDASSMLFGMCGWTADSSVNMNKCFTPEMSQGLDTE